MTKKQHNPKFNEGYNIRPMPIEQQSVRQRRLRRTKEEAKMIVCVTPDKGAFIWDKPDHSQVFRGLCVIRNLRGYELYEVWASDHYALSTRLLEQKLAEMFPLVWDISLLVEWLDDIPF
jgi:hypothetical protein